MISFETEYERQSQTVTVYTLDGHYKKIRISFSETVESLKECIASIYQSEGNQNWPSERIKLWLHGYYLEGNRTLSDYDLTSEDKITMLFQ